MWSRLHQAPASCVTSAVAHTPAPAESQSPATTVAHHQLMPSWSYTLWSLGIRCTEVPCINEPYASSAESAPDARSRNCSHARRTFQRAFLNVLNLATRRGVARQSCCRHAAPKADQGSKNTSQSRRRQRDTGAHDPERSTIPPWHSSLANCLLGTSIYAVTPPAPNTGQSIRAREPNSQNKHTKHNIHRHVP